MRLLVGVVVVTLGLLATGCGLCGLPCPEPTAIIVTVTASGAPGPVAGAFLVSSNNATGAHEPCVSEAAASTCHVSGVAGSYELQLGAPGYQTVMRNVTVQGQSPVCGCPTNTVQHLEVELVPVP